jgi:hypothetical protein
MTNQNSKITQKAVGSLRKTRKIANIISFSHIYLER